MMDMKMAVEPEVRPSASKKTRVGSRGDGFVGACPNACPAAARGGQCAAAWNAIPRLAAPPEPCLFVRDYAVPRKPFIVSGDGDGACAKFWGWPAADGRWRESGYLAKHPQVQAMQALFQRPGGARPVTLRAFMHSAGVWEQCGVSAPMTPVAAFDTLRVRTEMGLAAADGISMYLRAWEYDADKWEEEDVDGPAVPGINADVAPGVEFAKCLLTEALGSTHPLPRGLRWIYAGEPWSGSAAHVDPLATHAWMWQGYGRKEWRLVRRRPRVDAVPPVTQRNCASCAWVDAGQSLVDRKGKPRDDVAFEVVGAPSSPAVPTDLFSQSACDAVAAWATSFDICSGKQAVDCSPDGSAEWEAWAGDLHEGDLLFVPSGVLHAVRNAPPGLSVAISHNFVDGANVATVLCCLERAVRTLLSLEVERREEALQLLGQTLDVQSHGLLCAALERPELPQLFAAAAVQEERCAAESAAAACDAVISQAMCRWPPTEIR